MLLGDSQRSGSATTSGTMHAVVQETKMQSTIAAGNTCAIFAAIILLALDLQPGHALGSETQFRSDILVPFETQVSV